MKGVEIMNNEKLIKNICEDELEKVSGGHGLGDFAHNHPYLTFFGFNAIVNTITFGCLCIAKILCSTPNKE